MIYTILNIKCYALDIEIFFFLKNPMQKFELQNKLIFL